MTDTPNYWDMPDAELASAYSALRAVTTFTDVTEERLLFAEDAIMQRIGAPDDADPSTDPAWERAAVAFSEKVRT